MKDRVGLFIVRRPDGRLDVTAIIGSIMFLAIIVAGLVILWFYGRAVGHLYPY